MSGRDYYKLGSWNALCDQCGQKRKAEDLHLQWNGLRCCEKCFELRNSQDYVRGVPDPQGVPWSRQRGSLTFVDEATRPDGSTPVVVPIPTVTP
jgi:hypothetical protein